jgi:hypothetical protein
LELLIYLVDVTAIVVMIHELTKPRTFLAHVTLNFALFSVGAPPMGQLLVAMPPRIYKGAFASSGKRDASCSQLIGSASSDDQMLASQMASRLSTRTNKAVLMSCQLSQGDQDFLAGLDKEILSHKAAALAEKEIWRILQEQDKESS